MKLIKSKKYLYCILAIGFGYIVWNSPLTIDDLYYKTYGLSKFGEIFYFAISYGNGRLLGNMLIHFILQSASFRMIFQTFIVFFLWWLTCKTIQKDAWDVFPLGVVLFLAISPAIFGEVYLWSSAFANYIPGIICMFLAASIVKKKNGTIWNIVLLIISIAGQLFVEHTSLINLVYSLCVLIYYVKTDVDKSKKITSIVWFIGTVIGIGIMFLIPQIFYVPNEWETYQKININNIHDLVISVIANGMQISGIYLQNVFALVSLGIFLIIVAKPKRTAKGVLILSPIYGFVVSYFINEAWKETLCGALNLLILLLYLAAVILSIVQSKELNGKNESLFFIGMCMFSVLPLLIVYPIGPRCIFHSYVFLVLAILSLYSYNSDRIDEELNKIIIIFSIFGACIFVGGLAIHFHEVGEIDKMRLEYTQSKVEEGAKKIYIPKISSIYVKDNIEWSYGQVFYQEEKQDIEFEFIDYLVWKNTMGVQK